ncbi:MAG: hypothetical protein QM811_26270 [Pirellulales bacterium]
MTNLKRLVRANREQFEKIEREFFRLNLRGNALGIDKDTYEACLKGEEVSRGTIIKVVAALRAIKANGVDITTYDPVDLILRSDAYDLPYDPEYYRRLIYGYYLDYDRDNDMRLKWFTEDFIYDSMKRVAVTSRKNAFAFNLKGKFINQHGSKFNFQSSLINKHHYSLMAIHTRSNGVRIGFNASFCFRDGNAVIGLWNGVCQLENRTQVFAMVLSGSELEQATLDQYVSTFIIQSECLHLKSS